VLIDELPKTNATLDWVSSWISWIMIQWCSPAQSPISHLVPRVSSTNSKTMAKSVSPTGLVTAAKCLHFIHKCPQLCPGPLLFNEGVFLGHKQVRLMYLLYRFRSGMVSAAWRLACVSQISHFRRRNSRIPIRIISRSRNQGPL